MIIKKQIAYSLEQFIERWPKDKVKKMTLEEYVGVKNQDTFCQWVETKTRILGSIKGMTSIKFGIYQRKDVAKRPKNFSNDEAYTWQKSLGTDRNLAFLKVRNDIINTISFAESGQFDKIDAIALPQLFKWKIAFLYSDDRLIPVFKKKVLVRAANFFEFAANNKTKVSLIQNILIQNKPAELDVYQFMWEIFRRHGSDEGELVVSSENDVSKKKRIKRGSTDQRTTLPQERKGSRSYVAEQKHNKIQQILRNTLIREYGVENVIMEENFIDIKLLQPDFVTLYEVKSSSYASGCIREALGQILLYSMNDEDEEKRIKKHVVIGQYPATKEDIKYINFIQENLKLDFAYEHVPIDISI